MGWVSAMVRLRWRAYFTRRAGAQRSQGGREAAPSGLWTPFVRCGRAGAGVVEEELLGVAAVWAEVLAGEGGQFFRRDVCLLFKV